MSSPANTNKVAHSFDNVKSINSHLPLPFQKLVITSQINIPTDTPMSTAKKSNINPKLTSPATSCHVISNPPIPDSMIHHKAPSERRVIISGCSVLCKVRPYGVSQSRRVLSPSLFIKKYDRIRECLAGPLGLTTAQREVAMRLLRMWAYYGYVYPKAHQVAHDPAILEAAKLGLTGEHPLNCTGEKGVSRATFWRTVKVLKELGLLEVINRFLVRPHAQISNLYRLDRLAVVLARYLAEHGTPFREKWLTPALQMPGRLFWSFLDPVPVDSAGPGPPVYEGP